MTTSASSVGSHSNPLLPSAAAPTGETALPPALLRVAQTVSGRLRLRRIVFCGAWGLFAGAGASLAAVAFLRLRVWEMPDNASDLLFLIPPLAGLVLGTAWGATWRITPLAALRFADLRLGLHERLSTAGAACLSPAAFGDKDFAARQQTDATTHAQNADIRHIVPLRPLPRIAFWAMGAVLAAFSVWFLPTLPLFQSEKTRSEHQAVKQEGERLVRLAKALDKEAGKKKLPEAHKAALQMAALGKQLQKGKMDKQKALIKVAKLTSAMKQAQQSLASQTGVPKSLPGAGKDLARALASAQAAPKQNDKPDSKTGLNAPPPGSDKAGKQAATTPAGAQAAQKMQQSLAQNNPPSLAEQLGKMADDAAQGKPGDKAGQNEMGRQVSALADALKNTSLASASAPLKEAADAIKKGDMAMAAQKLREAAKKIGEAQSKSDDSAAMEKMAQALGQSGTGEEGQEGAQMAGTGEGEGEGDAFGKNGVKKGRGKGKGLGNGEDLVMGGDGEGENSGNSIGSGVGKLGGKKPPVGKAGKYLDAKYAPKENATLKRKTETHEVKDDQFSRLYVPGPNSTKLTGKRGEKGKETTSFFRGAPDKASASVPYYEVYGRYAPAVEAAQSRDDIPQAYKKQVKNYFDALRPEKK